MTIYANPYDPSSPDGFYFESLEEFQEKMEKATAEEFMIDYIDGDNPQLFEAAGINQGNIDIWFDELEDIADDDDVAIAIRYLLDTGYSLTDALEKHDEVQVWHGSSEDYAADLVEQTTDTSSLGWLENYIDYSRIANDMNLNSEISEVEHDIWITNCNEF
ncbi:MAG: antirestriction protein ArdA [Candidatus Thiodiazotropha taylori]|nr:antirestriction protein ArdA [Candidatus Thiodiazotropha taylori]MCG8095344.1 antirestriction protein ArdA [Candidatus Thiodiazotropha endolucinida]MCG7879000.1 antirestriction protein ArdA [Candidatus Thiodiazotropha taylori]MCG7883446.1 antirestriction protein ArdA [Candidatus Thiodiazotropha taylori]MCG7884450.1 antirestriction protein ArdA [Candidatus Thiodiazotropha taylori]